MATMELMNARCLCDIKEAMFLDPIGASSRESLDSSKDFLVSSFKH